MALLGICDAQLGTVVKENLVVFGIAPSTERVGQYVKVSRNPFCFPFEIVSNLKGGEMAGHL